MPFGNSPRTRMVVAILPHPNPLPKERGIFSGGVEKRMGVDTPERFGH